MTIWNRQLLETPGPRYRAIADAIADGCESGELQPGERLPSQRRLAERLDVAPGTVTRAYEEARVRGLIKGEVGRGSFVRWTRRVPGAGVDYSRRAPGSEDLFQNFPSEVPEEHEIWQAALREMADDAGITAHLRLSWSREHAGLVPAGVGWIARLGWTPSADRFVACSGWAGALAAVLEVCARPGEEIALAAWTHPGVAEQATRQGLVAVPLAIDEEGVLPEALEEACRSRSVRVLYVEPTLHNPTVALAGLKRRQALLEVVAQHDLRVVELDAASHLIEEPPPPLASLDPERVFFLGEIWMALSMALRTTFVVAPPAHAAALRRVAAASGVLPSALAASTTVAWLRSRRLEQVLASRQEETARRCNILLGHLGFAGLRAHDSAHHAWLPLPAGQRSELFVYRADEAGYAVTDGDWFRVGGAGNGQGVRICVGNASSLDVLEAAGSTLARLLSDNPGPRRPMA